MLSGDLNSERAMQVIIAIMRAFVQMRELAVSSRILAHKLFPVYPISSTSLSR